MSAEIWHGDARDLVERLPRPVNCIIADPPFGVDYRSLRVITPEGKRGARGIAGDKELDGARADFDSVMDALLPKTADECDLYVFTRWDVLSEWIETVKGLERHGFLYKMLLIWEKGLLDTGDIDANWGCGHEQVLYLKKGRREVNFRRPGVIHVDRPHWTGRIHPSEKPVALMETFISVSTNKGDLVVDPYSGSGASVAAAQNLGRDGIGFEVDDEYVRKSRARIEQPAFQF